MKGIESMPLRYIVIVLVAAIVIGAIVSFTTTMTNSALSGAATINTSISMALNKTLATLNQTIGV